MGRWLGGVYGNTKSATDAQNEATGVYTITDLYYMRQEGCLLYTSPSPRD